MDDNSSNGASIFYYHQKLAAAWKGHVPMVADWPDQRRRHDTD
jgi:hypothetical protein